MEQITVGFIGKVSSGKSSVINSICGGFVSNISLLRETTNMLYYYLDEQYTQPEHQQIMEKIGTKLEKIHTKSDKDRKDIEHISSDIISNIIAMTDNSNPIPSLFPKMGILDFPGLDDSDDKKNVFMRVFENNYTRCDIIVYVTDANSAFRDASEVATFRKIKDLIDKKNIDGTYIDIVIIVNKYDDIDDDDFAEIFNGIKEKVGYIPKFRYSSHRKIIDNENVYGINLYIPENDKIKKEYKKIMKTNYDKKGGGDYDNFFGFLQNCRKRLFEEKGKSNDVYNRRILQKIHNMYSIGNIYDINFVYTREPNITEFVEMYNKFKFDMQHITQIHTMFKEYFAKPITLGQSRRLLFYEIMIADFGEINDVAEKLFFQINEHMCNLDVITLFSILRKSSNMINYKQVNRKLFNRLILEFKIHKFLPSGNMIMRDPDTHDVKIYSGPKRPEYMQNMPHSLYVANLINNVYEKDMKYILLLSVCTDTEFRYYDAMNVINYELLNEHYPCAKENVKYSIIANLKIDLETLMTPIHVLAKLNTFMNNINKIMS